MTFGDASSRGYFFGLSPQQMTGGSTWFCSSVAGWFPIIFVNI